MASVLTHLYDFIDTNGDGRTKHMFLMDRPLTIIAISAIYVFLVKYAGPKFMQDRKPFELNRLMVVYNFFQIFFNIWLFREALLGGWWNRYNFRCEPADPSPTGDRMALASHIFFLSKFTDLIDTFFLVLRKKDSQISFLHVYHHSTLPLSGKNHNFSLSMNIINPFLQYGLAPYLAQLDTEP